MFGYEPIIDSPTYLQARPPCSGLERGVFMMIKSEIFRPSYARSITRCFSILRRFDFRLLAYNIAKGKSCYCPHPVQVPHELRHKQEWKTNSGDHVLCFMIQVCKALPSAALGGGLLGSLLPCPCFWFYYLYQTSLFMASCLGVRSSPFGSSPRKMTLCFVEYISLLWHRR